ncbi:hypothetical protein TRFO_42268 [Tritrichomonas foetus]|uniref:Uncharacterized protein n=1 Tax=Tritrichomonas foetus TaxID=1144522 RepID=A0A1J4KXC2_9EUKA|nr:hypothetical protein TRFO_42268 [Tritrichomonas foetus]|eukprot:OHT15826.1 hypothetical protein TRFO_42268 [Tritrichomonas foetus]
MKGREAPKELIDFNEVLFLPSTDRCHYPIPENRSSQRSPRKFVDNHVSLSQRAIKKRDGVTKQSPAVTTSSKGNVPAKFYSSPYLKDPFMPRPPESPRDNRSHAYPLNSARDRQIKSARAMQLINHSMNQSFSNRQRSTPSKGNNILCYSQKTKIFNERTNQFYNDLSTKYSLQNSGLPYRVDMLSFRNEALKKSAQARKIEEEENIKQTIMLNRECSKAVSNELANDHRFHLDHIINSHYPELRMVPVTDRVTRSSDENVLFI